MPPNLLDTFYKELSTNFSKTNPLTFSSTVEINAAHAIFHGHFKEVAVVPGVCSIQMIKEIVEDKLQTQLFLEAGNNIKFLAMVNPAEDAVMTIQFQLTDEGEYLGCSAVCSNKAGVCVKFKGRFRLV